MRRDCLIIDDVAAALARLTPLGRAVVGSAAAEIRDAIQDLSHRRGWTIVAHSDYVAWLQETRAKIPHDWILLDPLTQASEFAGRAINWRVTRLIEGDQTIARLSFRADAKALGEELTSAAGGVAIVDDISASGRTLMYAATVLAQHSVTTEQFVVCATTQSAVSAVKRQIREARWAVFLGGDWNFTAHLRDICPYLPYSGRPTAAICIDPTAKTAIDTRVPGSTLTGSIWQVAMLDKRVRLAVEEGYKIVGRRLSEMLGRPAVINDVGALGENVPVPVWPERAVTLNTPLQALASP